MGCNYYFKENVCDVCGRHGSEIHICKISCGWRPLFQTINSYDHGISINSFDEYVDYLRNEKGKLYNEYNELIDVESFINKIQNLYLDKSLRSHIDSRDNICFFDNEGFEFCNNEFS